MHSSLAKLYAIDAIRASSQGCSMCLVCWVLVQVQNQLSSTLPGDGNIVFENFTSLQLMGSTESELPVFDGSTNIGCVCGEQNRVCDRGSTFRHVLCCAQYISSVNYTRGYRSMLQHMRLQIELHVQRSD